jgi:hypothetical protein
VTAVTAVTAVTDVTDVTAITAITAVTDVTAVIVVTDVTDVFAFIAVIVHCKELKYKMSFFQKTKQIIQEAVQVIIVHVSAFDILHFCNYDQADPDYHSL